MIKGFNKFIFENKKSPKINYSQDLLVLEDIFSDLDLTLSVSKVSSNIRFEGIGIKDIPKLEIIISFDGSDGLLDIFKEMDSKVSMCESIGYSMSHSKIMMLDKGDYDLFADDYDCFGFSNPKQWAKEEIPKRYIERTLLNDYFIRRIFVYFNP